MIRKTSSKRRRRRQTAAIPAAPLHFAQSARITPRRSGSRQREYAAETLRPIVSLAFVLPLLLFYEFGSILTDQFAGKSGIDRWLHQLMDSLGIGQLVILPIVTAGVLLFWHHALSDRWKFQPRVLLGMMVESCCLGIILYFAGNAVHEIISNSNSLDTLAIGDTRQPVWWNRTIAFIGCGVYEELIFRLLMLNGIIWLGNQYFTAGFSKITGSILVSLLFAVLHYNLINPSGSEFEWFSFIFRFLASLMFCLLFLLRGFGIAVGTHCTYDVLTQI